MVSDSRFNLEGLKFHDVNAVKVPHAQWREIQELERRAFTDGLSATRSQGEVDYLLDWSHPLDFDSDRTNPMRAVERGRLRENQLITRPRAIIAYDEDRPVGYTYIAHNTSGGSNMSRRGKMLIPTKHYAWMREIAVDPEYQHRGIGLTLGYLAVEKTRWTEPVAAYVWEENEFMLKAANKLGLTKTGNLPGEHPFGPTAKAANVIRVQGKASDIRGNILNIPGAPEAIDYATQHAA